MTTIAGVQQMKRGALWLGGGTAITLVTYAAAASGGGGFYVVTSGAIFYGFLQFGYGLLLYLWEAYRNYSSRSQPLLKAQLFQLKSSKYNTISKAVDVRDTRWHALTTYDKEISSAVDRLQPYGSQWIEKLRVAFFALNEDKEYLENIVERLIIEAKKESENQAPNIFYLQSGEICSEQSLNILRNIEQNAFRLSIDDSETILAASPNGSTYYLRSNTDIQNLGNFLKWRAGT